MESVGCVLKGINFILFSTPSNCFHASMLVFEFLQRWIRATRSRVKMVQSAPNSAIPTSCAPVMTVGRAATVE